MLLHFENAFATVCKSRIFILSLLSAYYKPETSTVNIQCYTEFRICCSRHYTCRWAITYTNYESFRFQQTVIDGNVGCGLCILWRTECRDCQVIWRRWRQWTMRERSSEHKTKHRQVRARWVVCL